MSDVIIIANKQSALDTALMKEKLSDVYTYRCSYNLPISSRSFLKIEPRNAITAPFHSKECTIDITKFSMIEKMCLDIGFTTPVGDNTLLDGTHWLSRLFSLVSFNASSTIIYQYGPEFVNKQIEDADTPQGLTLQALLNGNRATYAVAIAGNGTYPVFGPFFENTSMFIDNRFCEQLQLRLVVDTFANIGLAEALTALNITAHVWYKNLSEEALNAYRAYMYPDNARLQQLIYDTYQETPLPLAAATNQILRLRCPGCITSTTFYASNILRNLGPTSVGQIVDVSVQFSGVKIMESIPMRSIKYDEINYDKNDCYVSQTGDINHNIISASGVAGRGGVYTINWAQFRDKVSNSGNVSLLNVNDPMLIFTVDALLTAVANTYQIQAVSIYFKVFSVDSNSGKISVSGTL